MAHRLKEICEKYPDEIKYENPAHLTRRQFDFEKDLEIMSCSIDKAGLNIVRQGIKVPDWKWQKIIFVKEPIERLAWYFQRDKLQRNQQLRKNFQEQVVTGYSIFKSVDNLTYVTSTEHSKEEISAGNSVNFTDFLVGKFMKNWRPYYKICSPCTIKYNQIVKLDFAIVDEKLVSMYYVVHTKICMHTFILHCIT